MKKYQCNACEINICTAEYQGGLQVPFKCTGIFDMYHKPQWKEITREAATLPKLTVEVFDRPDCPDWAKIAVVNSNGRAYYGPYKEAIINSTGGWYGLYEEQGKWKRIGNELFDASDWQNSLIKRPTKLPDWCKVGEWVYYRGYRKIIEVKALILVLESAHCGNLTVYPEEIGKEVKQARLRPYNAEEMRALVGKVIATKEDSALVVGYRGCENKVVIGCSNNSFYFSAERLLEYNATLDSSPCGVLEHLEDGEWVR